MLRYNPLFPMKVATMMSCPLPMPLPTILSTTLHSDFPPVHIGVKTNFNRRSHSMQLLQAPPPTLPHLHLAPHHNQQQQPQPTATGAFQTAFLPQTAGMLQQHPHHPHHQQQQAAAAAAVTFAHQQHQMQQQIQQQQAAVHQQQQQQFQQHLHQQQQQQHQQQQQQQQMLQMLQFQMNTAAISGPPPPATPTKFAQANGTGGGPTTATTFFAAPGGGPLALLQTCQGTAAVTAATLYAANVLAPPPDATTPPPAPPNNVNNNNNIVLSATRSPTTTTRTCTTTTTTPLTTSRATSVAASGGAATAAASANAAIGGEPAGAETHTHSSIGLLAAAAVATRRSPSAALLGRCSNELARLGRFTSYRQNASSPLMGSSPSSLALPMPYRDTAVSLSPSPSSSSPLSLSSGSYSSASSDCSMPSPSSLHISSPKKRGSDELLSQAAIMAPASDNNNQDLATKKAKLDSGTVIGGGVVKASKVIHLRNIPNESSESDVISLGVPFGRVTNVLVLKGKNQAFIEMADEVAATSMVSCYTVTPPQMRGRMVYVQFSNHRELKIDQNHGNPVSSSEYRVTSPSSGDSPLPLCGTNSPGSGNPGDGPIAVLQNNTNAVNSSGGPNTVLRVVVESLMYPVSLDILHQIFQRFGKVLKIVTFTKNNAFQALIQYPDAHSAQHAKSILDGQNIYNGCCTLRIDNSKLTALNVKYNNDKSRDFTNPALPPGEPGADIMPTAGGLVNANDLLLIAARQRPSLTGDKIVNGMSAPGVIPPYALGLGAPIGGAYNSGIPNLSAFALANSGALQSSAPAVRGFSNVLLVSNLNEEMVTPDALFTLFGVYGDVQRVKILYNKKDSALIQMAEPQQAFLAMSHLDKLRLWGKPIRVMASKHQAVQLPKEGQPDAGLTRDYSQNPLHRFKKPGSKNYQNIYPPSATLHLSNIPSSCTEEDIKEAFNSNNFEVKAFKFFPKDRKMALLQLSSVEEAVLALIKMHNHQLSESNHLRVSFSKSNI